MLLFNNYVTTALILYRVMLKLNHRGAGYIFRYIPLPYGTPAFFSVDTPLSNILTILASKLLECQWCIAICTTFLLFA